MTKAVELNDGEWDLIKLLRDVREHLSGKRRHDHIAKEFEEEGRSNLVIEFYEVSGDWDAFLVVPSDVQAPLDDYGGYWTPRKEACAGTAGKRNGEKRRTSKIKPTATSA